MLSAFCSSLPHPSLLPRPLPQQPQSVQEGMATAVAPWWGLCCPLSPSFEQGHGCSQDFGIELAFLSTPTACVGL